MSMKFNDESKKPRFISRPNPLTPHSHQIFEYKAGKEEYEPVGDYTVIDLAESGDITAKKVTNLISLMNGRKPLIDFTNLTKERVLFTMNPKSEDSDKDIVVFRAYDGNGVSKENAVLKIEKGVFQ